jgi:mercuric ion transport protein
MKSLKTAEHTGWVGALVSALGCASCFPLLGTLGASIGLGFLSQFEGLFVIFLLPIFTGIALISSAIAWRNHRKFLRGFVGVIGPICAFLAMYVFFGFSWGQYLLTGSLFFMVAVSVWGIFNPPLSRAAHQADLKQVTK